MAAVLAVWKCSVSWTSKANSRVGARLCSFKMLFLSSVPAKIKGLVVFMIFCFQAPPEPLPAEDSMFQFALLLWFSVFSFVAELCLRKLVMFCAFLGPAADIFLGTDVPALLSLFLPSCSRTASALPSSCCLHFGVWKCFVQGQSWPESVRPWLGPALVSLQGAHQERSVQGQTDPPWIW